jgi:PilZ domain
MGEDNRRSEPRDSVFLRANLRSEMVQLSVTVRNLSSRGAMIHGAECGPVGSEVTLHLSNIGRVYGTVAWVEGDRCGIRFNHAIDHRLARRQVPSENFGRASHFIAPPKRSV